MKKFIIIFVVAASIGIFIGTQKLSRQDGHKLSGQESPKVEVTHVQKEKATAPRTEVATNVEAVVQTARDRRPVSKITGAFVALQMAQSLVYGELRDLNLSATEQQRLVYNLVVFADARAEIESDLVEEKGFDGKTLAVTIPAYPEYGEALRDLFHAQLIVDLSEERTNQILDKVSGKLDQVFFKGFGSASQSYAITQNPDGVFQINWSLEGGDSAHARTIADSPKWGSSGFATSTMEGLQSGEYRSLFGAVDRRFGAGRKNGQVVSK
jgi:hypothetical protein